MRGAPHLHRMNERPFNPSASGMSMRLIVGFF